MPGMPFTDYFLAPDDTIAVTALPDGGPVSTDLRPVACGVHRSAKARRASDHLPIWARLAPG